MERRVKIQEEIEQEMLELNEQFSTFLHTKGIKQNSISLSKILKKEPKKLLQALPHKLQRCVPKHKIALLKQIHMPPPVPICQKRTQQSRCPMNSMPF